MTEDEETVMIGEKIAAHVRNGVTFKDAAATERLPWVAFVNWMQWGEAGREPFASFAALVKQAESETVVKVTGVLYEAALTSPRWALAWLERRRREDWWLRPEQAKDASKMSDEELVGYLRDMLEQAEARLAGKR